MNLADCAYQRLEEYIRERYDNPNQQLYNILLDGLFPLHDETLIGIVAEYKAAFIGRKTAGT